MIYSAPDRHVNSITSQVLLLVQTLAEWWGDPEEGNSGLAGRQGAPPGITASSEGTSHLTLGHKRTGSTNHQRGLPGAEQVQTLPGSPGGKVPAFPQGLPAPGAGLIWPWVLQTLPPPPDTRTYKSQPPKPRLGTHKSAIMGGRNLSTPALRLKLHPKISAC